MGSPLSSFACIGTMNRPLTRPSGTLFHSEGERDGVRGRFMERRPGGRLRARGRFGRVTDRNGVGEQLSTDIDLLQVVPKVTGQTTAVVHHLVNGKILLQPALFGQSRFEIEMLS